MDGRKACEILHAAGPPKVFVIVFDLPSIQTLELNTALTVQTFFWS